MTGEDQPRPSISAPDFKLRLFLDTNVLINYVLNNDSKKSKTFIDLLKNNPSDIIELVTSDYVLWEFYGHFRDELYVKKLVEEHNCGYIGANKECIRRKYDKITLADMDNFGETIKQFVKQFSINPVSIHHLIGQNGINFSEAMDKLLQSSKFSYKDAIVFVSALCTNSHFIITHDESFSSDRHLSDLKQAVRELPLESIIFKEPAHFSSNICLKKEYKKWFSEHNKEKVIGQIIKCYPRLKVVSIECRNGYYLRVGDYIYAIKFDDSDQMVKITLKIYGDSLRDYQSKQPIEKGDKVTLKLPDDVTIPLNKLKKALIYLAS